MNGTPDDLTRLARRCWGALETLHTPGYFAPEPRAAYKELGLRAGVAYFAARSAPLGVVPAEVVQATFYVFAPVAVRAAIPAVWEVTTPEQVTAARYRGVSATLRRLLGEDADGPAVSQAATLAREACAGLTVPGRPLYAATSALPWPDAPLLQLWHAATLLREHRGDGHVAALVGAGLDPVESIVTGGAATGTTAFMRSSRGWTEQEWADAEDRLRRRGLLDDEGGLTDAGRALRSEVEQRTETAAMPGWEHLGAERAQRLLELVRPLQKAVLASGVFPDGVLPRR